MRICLVYDCLYPHTVGGGERYYRALAERLAGDGHDVAYLTLRQWDRGTDPGVPGVRVVPVGPRMALYGADGNRRIEPPLVFGLGVLAHLARHGRDYDVVHTASFPYFSLLAAALLRPVGRYRLVVDWFEFWSRSYWREYLGARGGAVGWLVQRLCLKVRQHAFTFAEMTADRLRQNGLRGPVEVLGGAWTGPLTPSAPVPVDPEAPTVLYAGRHIAEKQVPALVPAVEVARRSVPGLRARILGDGPEHGQVVEAVTRLGLRDVVDVPGFVSSDELATDMRRAACLVLPSRREGYGLVVVEACAAGTPVVLVAHEDNAATALVEEGVNGFVAPSASPEDLGAAIVRAVRAGQPLRESTAAWFAREAPRLSVDHALDLVSAAYAGGVAD